MPNPTHSRDEDPSAPTEAEDRRWRRRKSTLWAAGLDTGTDRYKCLVLNVSPSGAMLQLSVPLALYQPVTLTIDRRGAIRAELVWCLPDKVGIQFIDDREHVARILGDMLPQ